MIRRFSPGYALFGLALAPAFEACRSPHDPVVIRFEGVDVRRSAFVKELEPLAKNGTDTSDPQVRLSAFSRFLEERLVAIATERHGYKDASENRGDPEGWLAAALAAEKVPEAEARAYYEAHPEIAKVEESVTIREILLATQQDARDVVRILNSDHNAFELLARTRSGSPQASGGGLLGSFRRGELPAEIEHSAFALSPGQISGMITTSFGYHVIRLESKTLPTTRSFDEARGDVEARLTEAKSRLKMKQLMDGLVSQAQVNYDAVTAR